MNKENIREEIKKHALRFGCGLFIMAPFFTVAVLARYSIWLAIAFTILMVYGVGWCLDSDDEVWQ